MQQIENLQETAILPGLNSCITPVFEKAATLLGADQSTEDRISLF